MAERIVQEYGVDFSQADKDLQEHIGLWQQLDTQTGRFSKQSPFARQTNDLVKFNNQLRSGGVLFKQIANNPKALKAEITRLTQEYFKLTNAQERATRSGNWRQTEADIQRVRARLLELNTLQQSMQGAAGGGGGGMFAALLGAGAGLLGGSALLSGAKELLTNIITVRAETQKLEKQLEVTLGSKGAGVAGMKLINSFANKTPHEVDGVTRAFNRLVDVGIVPTEKQLFQISDIAVAKGKDMLDYVEAIADAQQGENERLKEFGITARKQGDDIAYTFKGVTTVVKNTSSAINEYLLSLGNVAGIQGQTAEAGKTLEGRWSTLKDTGRAMANEIGTALQPALEGTIDLLQKGADASLDFLKAMKLVMGDQGFWTTVAQFITGDYAGLAKGFADAAKKEAARIDHERRRKLRRGEDPDLDPLEKKRQELAAQQQKNEEDRKKREADQKAKDDAKKAADKRKQEQEQIKRETEQQNQRILEEKKKLTEELFNLEQKERKDRLETLDKGSEEYLKLRREIDAEEIDLERRKLIELGRMATGETFYNTKTKKVEVKPNENYKLPQETEDLYRRRKTDAMAASALDYYDIQKKRQQEQRDKLEAAKKGIFETQTKSVLLSQREALYNAEAALQKKAGENEIDYEKRKNAALLKIRLDYAHKLLQTASMSGDKEQILEAKELILDLQHQIKENKKIVGGPQDLWELLGIKAPDNEMAMLREAAGFAKQAFSEILSQQIDAEQQRIDSYDRQIDAKQREIDVELELSRRGLANNLLVKRQEQQQIEAERKKAVESQRRYQQIQLAMNATEQASEITLAIAKLIKSGASLGPLGIVASGISIAAMFGLMLSSIAKARSLPKYHSGDEVTAETARIRAANGDRKPNEVDARLEIGEFVGNRFSAQSNLQLYKNLNRFKRRVRGNDLRELLSGTGIVLPDSVAGADMQFIAKVQERGFADTAVHERLDQVNGHLAKLVKETAKPQPKRTQIGQNKWRVEDEKGNVTIETYTV